MLSILETNNLELSEFQLCNGQFFDDFPQNLLSTDHQTLVHSIDDKLDSFELLNFQKGCSNNALVRNTLTSIAQVGKAKIRDKYISDEMATLYEEPYVVNPSYIQNLYYAPPRYYNNYDINASTYHQPTAYIESNKGINRSYNNAKNNYAISGNRMNYNGSRQTMETKKLKNKTKNRILKKLMKRKPFLSQSPKGHRLWEFIMDILTSAKYLNLVKWENQSEGVFRFIDSEGIAKLWGRKKNNIHMTYEKLSRAMRTYYASQILEPVPKNGCYPKKLVYKFGPRAYGFLHQDQSHL